MLGEKLHKGAESEGTEQRAQTNQAAQQPGNHGAQRIGEDAAAEVGDRQAVGQHQGERVIGRYAQIGGLIQRSPQRDNQHADDHPEQLQRERVGRTENAG